ncbi:MAG: hypothetical protein WD359_00455 [Dehalococcoidia bacterium]
MAEEADGIVRRNQRTPSIEGDVASMTAGNDDFQSCVAGRYLIVRKTGDA